MKHSIAIFFIFAALFTFPTSTLSIGDSGGGCVSSRLEQIAATGTPSELEAALSEEAERWLGNRSWLSKKAGRLPKACTPLSRDPNCFSSKAAVIHSLVNQNYTCNAPNATKLIDHAAARGNLAVLRYLLELGANPSGLGDDYSPLTIFFRCSKPTTGGGMLWLSEYSSLPSSTLRNTSDIVAAYDLLISGGGDINFVKAGENKTALHTCKDPDIVKLLLSRGANPNVGSIANPPPGGGGTALDHQVFQHFVWPYYNNTDDSLSIIRAISSAAASKRISRYTQARACEVCSAGKLRSSCEQLAPILEVKTKEIFSVALAPMDDRARWRYCSSLTDE